MYYEIIDMLYDSVNAINFTDNVSRSETMNDKLINAYNGLNDILRTVLNKQSTKIYANHITHEQHGMNHISKEMKN